MAQSPSRQRMGMRPRRLSVGYDGYDAYTRTIEHCQNMLMDDTAEHGKTR